MNRMRGDDRRRHGDPVAPGTGMLLDPRQSEALAVALERVLRDVALRRSLGEVARTRPETFSIQHDVAAIEVYADVLGLTASHPPNS